MSREIKFRAWDKTTREMLTADLFDPISWEDLSILDYILQGAETPDHDYHGRDAYQLMQYTGLKDKNGVEIYEGDLIEANSYILSSPFVVEFGSAAFLANSVSNPYGGLLPIGQLADTEAEIRIVGNIYENPELLGSRGGDE